jgi:anti-anti-sigma regulatory factor
MRSRLLADLIDGQGNLDVVIDLRHAVIDHGTIGALVAASDRISRRGGGLVLSSPPPGAWDLLHSSGLQIDQPSPTR